MKVIIIKNGVMQIVLSPETEIETLALKEMDGATLRMASDKIVVIEQTLPGAAIIKKEEPKLANKE